MIPPQDSLQVRSLKKGCVAPSAGGASGRCDFIVHFETEQTPLKKEKKELCYTHILQEVSHNSQARLDFVPSLQTVFNVSVLPSQLRQIVTSSFVLILDVDESCFLLFIFNQGDLFLFCQIQGVQFIFSV